MKRLAILVLCLLPVGAPAVERKKTFEVASVKPSAPPGGDGHNFHVAAGARFGPGTADSTRWVCDNCSVGLLLQEAYSLKRFQITGPKWLDSERFDIVARVAEGATKDDLRLMQQNLLVERFGLQARMEKKEMQVFDLVVGKNPPKLKEASPAKPIADGPPAHEFGHGGPSAGPTPLNTQRMGNGGFDHPTDRTVTFTMHGVTRHQAVGEDMQQLADMLAAQLDKPVTDSTGLTGKYDFFLTFSGGKAGDGGGAMGMMMHGGPGGPGGGGHDGNDSDTLAQPPLPRAIQDQLGLRLEAKKGMAELLIIDHIERVPSGN